MNGARIMIVEDNTTVAEDCSDCLLSLGYSVTSIVATGEESIERAASQRPDAVIMDIHLRDEMNGIEAAKQIHRQLEIPVVFLSAYSDRELIASAGRAGSYGYLVKPFEERELLATLEMALQKAKAERERREEEARLRKEEKMEGLRLMAGSIAHKFNNILHATLGFTELALKEIENETWVSELVLEAKKSASRAADISSQMLLYTGQGYDELRPVNISRQVENAVLFFEQKADNRVSLSTYFADEDESILADPALIQQMLTNLFDNALEAIGDDEGTLSISTRIARLNTRLLERAYFRHEQFAPGDCVVIEVSDSGCGMDSETLNSAFDPFFTTKFMGRGLGLAVVLGVVRGLRGAIDLESEPGVGTSIRVIIPLSTGAEERASEDVTCKGTGSVSSAELLMSGQRSER